MGYDNCFVFGCERSGTTPLVHLLQANTAMAIGMERYIYVLRRVRANRNPSRHFLTPDLFERDRFLDFREEDTNQIPPKFDRHYDRIIQRFDLGQIRYVGDKLMPADVKVMNEMVSQFPDARYVFIFRDPVRVANSFVRRARDPNDSWPAKNGLGVAIRHWHEAFDAADSLAARIGAERVFVVRTEALFEEDESATLAMFRFLGLESDKSVLQRHRQLSAEWAERQCRPLDLTADEQAEVGQRADHETRARYDERAALQVERWSGEALSRPVRRRQRRSTRRFTSRAERRYRKLVAEQHAIDMARLRDKKARRLEAEAEAAAAASGAEAQMGAPADTLAGESGVDESRA